ncbi:5395_t:CDS:2 [Cetraspora pellucida]|uniref:5395_t:CDS:1 n=1 Tax=Cetraspora pellucida TaxID=1433469 RepID=A0A9N9J6N9_9GLOM|nr:5395_t:CDS:2 [Cetraspora pellucida]
MGYNNGCKKLHYTKREVATKYTFTKIFGPVFAATYTSKTIINAFRTTETWPLNPTTISSDHLDTSLVTECELLPLSHQIIQPTGEPSSNEELETFKNPDICPLKIALKYSISQLSSQTNEQESCKAVESKSQPVRKRKTMPFAHLLTNKNSLCKLEAAEEAAKSKAENVKRKKEIAIQKKTTCELKRQKKELK